MYGADLTGRLVDHCRVGGYFVGVVDSRVGGSNDGFGTQCPEIDFRGDQCGIRLDGLELSRLGSIREWKTRSSLCYSFQ